MKPTSASGGQLDSHTSRVSTDEPQTESQTASSASLAGVNALQPVSSTELFPVEASEIEGPMSITPQPDTATGPLEDPLTANPPMIPEKAHHPELLFPLREFGKQRRSFCSSWYCKYPWLHYQEGSDSVLCYYCLVADKRGLQITHNKDEAFTRNGFSNWKKALERFEKHQGTIAHRQAVEMVKTIPNTTRDVGELLSEAHAQQKAENREMLQVILSTIRYLGRQGLALRGRYKVDDLGRSGELDSNFLQLLKTRGEDKPKLLKWMDKSQDKFTSPDIQNEILSIMAQSILQDIVSSISGKWFTIMADETTDLSNTEQMVLCLRYVDDDLEVHEEVIGLYSLESTSADMIMSTIEDVLLRLNLKVNNCRGQCYDGASTMSGCRSGVVTKLSALEHRALYTHCYGHALSLATQDALKGIKIMEETLDTVYEITKLIKKSPKRDVLFQKFKDDVTPGSPGIRVLCPTRWTVRAEALASISENYQALQLTWDAAKESTRDTEMKTRIGGVAAQMEKFSFFFGVELGRKILNMADNLSRTLQASTLSACEGQRVVKMTLQSLQSIRSDECFDLFWEYIERRRSLADVSSPTLPRRRKAPRRYEIGESAPEHPSSVQDHYRRIYFESIDLAVAAITARFNQKGFQMLHKLETVLTNIKQPQHPEMVKDVLTFYGSDFHQSDRLKTQLHLLHTGSDKSLTDLESIITYLKTLDKVERECFSEVVKVVKLILVMPATNAVSERSFSALRRLKSWLRTTTCQARLNWCMILHVHKDKTDSLQLNSVANEFVSRNNSRMQIFGYFK